jgi:hypothetical protein
MSAPGARLESVAKGQAAFTMAPREFHYFHYQPIESVQLTA